MATRMGTVIDEKYEILKQIGKGGMSVVYLAMDKRLNKQWAVKEIRKTASGKNDEIVINSLLAEANLMKKLDHPAFPRIVDIIDNGQTLYVIMDYIEGEPLEKILDEYGAQPEGLVISWAMQLADALGYLHSQKPPVIYRDMKPANVMLKPEGNLKVIDFGIAREYKEQNLSDTTVLGTKGYAPPEQHGARQTDARSDIYALGMTMCHLLTGIDPRSADYRYVPVRQQNPELSEGIETIVNKCTALDPEERYQNCDELMYDLQHPDQIGEGARKKKKRRWYMFAVSFALSIVMGSIGAAGQVLYKLENDRNYDLKLNATGTHEEKVNEYLDAIDLYGADARAYIKLLQEYQNHGNFGDPESKKFSGKYNANQDEFNKKSTDYLDLLYEAGITYFYFYDGSDSSFRSRILNSKPYFDAIVASGNSDYVHYEIAQSYQILADFYNRYVVNLKNDKASDTSATGVINEPEKKDYDNLLDSLKVCMNNMESYKSADAASMKLTFYREIANLLNDHRKGFASTQVNENDLLDILTDMKLRAEKLTVTQSESILLQESVMASCDEYKANISRTYHNTEERRQ